MRKKLRDILRLIKKHFLVAAAVSLVSTSFLISFIGMEIVEGKAKEVPYSEIEKVIKQNAVKKIVIDGNKVKVWTSDGKELKSNLPYQNETDLLEKIAKGKIVVYDGNKGKSSGLFNDILNAIATFVPLAIFFAVFKNTPWRGNFLKDRVKLDVEEKPDVKLSDIAGMEEVKQEIIDVIDYLKNPSKYEELGGRPPKGILLYGEPGVGKTYLAKALAGEADVPFINVSGAEFIELFAGIGASRVRTLFDKARQLKPCIIFIDEIDAIGQTRAVDFDSSSSEREQTLNQLLVEMDGFATEDGILIIGATNRPDILDPALLRPGRFDRQIFIPKPNVKERLEILKVHAKTKKLSNNIDLEIIAKATSGFTGADLENLLNEAAINAARSKKTEITQEDLESALDKIMIGLERKGVAVTEKEKEMIAFHEAGHTIMSILKDKTNEIHKVSIIPRGFALGVTASLPTEDKYLTTKEELLSALYVLMGGRASEEVFFGKNRISTGASNDIERATIIAYNMIGIFGMSERLGPVALLKDKLSFLSENQETNIKGTTLLDSLDEEVSSLLNQIYQETLKEIETHQETVKALAKALIEKETLSKEEVMEICQKAPKGGSTD